MKLKPYLTLIFFILVASCTNPFGKTTSVDSLFTPGVDGENTADGEVLAIIGLSNDLDVTTQKSWTWSCNRPCNSRFIIDQSPLSQPTGPFTASQSASIDAGNGTFYIHVQGQDEAGEVSQVFHASVVLDNTAPSLTGQIVFVSSDRSATQTNSMTWTEASSAPAVVDRYELSISTETGDGLCTISDVSQDTLSWFPVPAAADFISSGYQIVQGNVDNNNAVINFSLLESVAYCVSLRAIDQLDQASNIIFSDPMKLPISPSTIGDLFIWLDSSATNSLFQNSDCTSSPSFNSDPVACWRDQSLHGRHFIQNTSARRPILSSLGLDFDGIDDVLSNASINFNADTDTSYFVVTDFENQSNNGGSCCRPLVSYVTNSSNFYPWIGSTRGNLSPPNSIFHGWQSSMPFNPIAASPGDSFLVTALHDGTLKRWNTFTNGSQTASNLVIPSSYSSSTILNIGGDANNSARRYNGIIKEVIFYDRILSDTEIKDIEGYLACKWNIREDLDPGHPYYDVDNNSDFGCP